MPIRARIRVVVALAAIGGSLGLASAAQANTTPFNLAGGSLTQSWGASAPPATDNSWTDVPSIEGRVGNGNLVATQGDPRGLTAELPTLNVDAGNTTLEASITDASPSGGGIFEFVSFANPVVAFQGSTSTTAGTPGLYFYLNAAVRQDVTVTYDLRDVDIGVKPVTGTQPVNLQYKVGSGPWTDAPGGYVADAALGATTPVSVVLPDATDFAADLRVRVYTRNADGADQLIGVDNIVISSAAGVPPPVAVSSAATAVTAVGATLNGTIDANNAATDYQFEYGLTTGYGSLAPTLPADAGTGTFATPVEERIRGLSPNTVYNYRLVAKRGGVTLSTGANQTFTTRPSTPLVGTVALGVTSADGLVTFNTATPGTIGAPVPIAVAGNEDVVGIDVRPRTGALLGVVYDTATFTARVVEIDRVSGAATQLGASFAIDGGAASTAFGVDVNPAADALRIVTSNDRNYRFRLSDNTLQGTGSPPRDGDVTPADNSLVATAYRLDVDGVETPFDVVDERFQYTIDSAGDTLNVQTPNSGLQNGPLPLGIDVGDQVGLDIFGSGDQAFLTDVQGTTTSLYSLNLEFGETTLIGSVGAGNTALRAFALDPAPLQISEFRPAGNGAQADNFVEVVNASDYAFDISGYQVRQLESAGTGTTVAGTVPPNTVLGPRAHFTFRDAGQTSLLPFVSDAPLADPSRGGGVAVYSGNTAGLAGGGPGIDDQIGQLDAVSYGVGNEFGDRGEYDEEANVSLARPSDSAGSTGPGPQISFVRSISLASGFNRDSQNAVFDFLPVADDAVQFGSPAFNYPNPALGAPGLENQGDPTRTIPASIPIALANPGLSSTLPPNRVRVNQGAADDQILLRRRVTNNTGSPVTRLRIRINEITTLNRQTTTPPSTGTKADLRFRDANGGAFDSDANGSLDAVAIGADVQFPTLEVPASGIPTGPARSTAGVETTGGGTNPGGGVNSYATVDLGGAMGPGQSRFVELAFAVRASGSFSLIFTTEGAA